jgi:hypothetical protein
MQRVPEGDAVLRKEFFNPMHISFRGQIVSDNSDGLCAAIEKTSFRVASCRAHTKTAS